MNLLKDIKLIAELITSIAAAGVLLIHLFKLCYPIKKFLVTTVPSFFKGYTDINGKKTRFFKGLKRRRERNDAIIKAVSTNSDREDILVLDKDALFDIIAKSRAFQTVHR